MKLILLTHIIINSFRVSAILYVTDNITTAERQTTHSTTAIRFKNKIILNDLNVPLTATVYI